MESDIKKSDIKKSDMKSDVKSDIKSHVRSHIRFLEGEQKKIRMGSGVLQVARGGSGAKAHPLAARPRDTRNNFMCLSLAAKGRVFRHQTSSSLFL